MAKIKKDEKEQDVRMIRAGCLAREIIRISGDNSGQGVEVKLTSEEHDYFHGFHGDVGNEIYQLILYSLEHVFGTKSKGFHWEYNPHTRIFKTHTYGL
jgi:hypothetical protein